MLTHIRTAVMRRAAVTALGALLLASCGASTGGPNGDDDTAGDSSKSSAVAEDLRIGQPSRQPVEIYRYGKTGKFIITPQRVVPGKASDLGDDPKFKGMTTVWVYVNAKFVGGDAMVKGPMVMEEVGVVDKTGHQGQSLISIADLPSQPKDCKDDDPDAVWKKGENHTKCAPFVIPEGESVARVIYAMGYYQDPLMWESSAK